MNNKKRNMLRSTVIAVAMSFLLTGCGEADEKASLEAINQSLEAELATLQNSNHNLNRIIENQQEDIKNYRDEIKTYKEAQKSQQESQDKSQNTSVQIGDVVITIGEQTPTSPEVEKPAEVQNPYECKPAAMQQSAGDSYKATIGDSSFYGRANFEKISFYDLDVRQNVGVLRPDNLRKSASKTINFEACYGVRATAEGFVLSLTPYNHFSKAEHPMSKSELVSDLGDTREITLDYGQTTKVDCSNLAEGLYYLHTVFDEAETTLYFYVASNGVFTVRVEDYRTVKAILGRNATVAEALAKEGVTPENSLYIGDIVYPCAESENHRCDTGRWAQLSHDLLDEHPEWTDEMKVFVLADWMVRNITYDDWKVKNGHSRAYSLGVWDGTYSMWNTKVGVCADFSNVMVIMLREQGIPTTSFESDTHMWNVVYIDGQWRELDITDMLAYHVDDFERENVTNRGVSYRLYFGYVSSKIVSVGYDIWTIERSKK